MASSQHCVQLACSRGLYIGWRLWRLNYRTHSGEEQVDVRTHKHKRTPFDPPGGGAMAAWSHGAGINLTTNSPGAGGGSCDLSTVCVCLTHGSKLGRIAYPISLLAR